MMTGLIFNNREGSPAEKWRPESEAANGAKRMWWEEELVALPYNNISLNWITIIYHIFSLGAAASLPWHMMCMAFFLADTLFYFVFRPDHPLLHFEGV